MVPMTTGLASTIRGHRWTALNDRPLSVRLRCSARSIKDKLSELGSLRHRRSTQRQDEPRDDRERGRVRGHADSSFDRLDVHLPGEILPDPQRGGTGDGETPPPGPPAALKAVDAVAEKALHLLGAGRTKRLFR